MPVPAPIESASLKDSVLGIGAHEEVGKQEKEKGMLEEDPKMAPAIEEEGTSHEVEVTGEVTGRENEEMEVHEEVEGPHESGETGIEQTMQLAQPKNRKPTTTMVGEMEERKTSSAAINVVEDRPQSVSIVGTGEDTVEKVDKLIGPPMSQSKFHRMNESEKRMARLRAFGLLHSLLVLAFVWSVSEMYIRMHPEMNFVKIRTYGLWLASGFRGLWIFAMSTVSCAIIVVCAWMHSRLTKRKNFHRRSVSSSSSSSSSSSTTASQTPSNAEESGAHLSGKAMVEAVDQIPSKTNGNGKPHEREALFWVGCVLLNVFTLELLTALLFYTPMWARPLIAP